MIGGSIVNNVVGLFDPEFCWLITMSLFHSLWLGAIIALFVAGLLRIKGSGSIHNRFAVRF